MKNNFIFNFTIINSVIIFILLFIMVDREYINTNNILENDTIPSKYINTFKYKGHTMIYIYNKGVFHDPECQYCYDRFD